MGFQFEQHRLGLWDLSWDLKKTISWEMGLGPSLHDPLSVIVRVPVVILNSALLFELIIGPLMQVKE